MPETTSQPITHRYDFVYLFDVTDGNPNGDPDAGNLPRVDPETGQGLVTDVCLKRKIRNYVQLLHPSTDGYEIYVKERAILNQQHERAYAARKIDPKKRKKGQGKEQEDRELTKWMCENFFDIRTFGAVMNTGVDAKCGQVRGPVQFSFARSIDPIVASEFAITVCAARKADKPIDEQIGIQGRKFAVPYGLYRVHGYINAMLADPERHGTGFSEIDLDLLKRALDQMFEHDRSAARGNMAPRACIAFKHESALGNARADQLFKRVTIERNTVDDTAPARSFDDYVVKVDKESMPAGVEIEHWITP